MKAPFIYVASATGIGGRWENSYGWLRDAAKAAGFGTVLLMDRYAKRSQVDALHAAGLDVWAWEEPGAVRNPDGHEYHTDGLTQRRFLDMGYDGCVLQTETPDQRQGALMAFQLGLAAGKEKHCVTYYFGFDDGHGPEHWADLKAAGVTKMHAECYAADGHTDVKAYLDYGTHLLGASPGEVICAFGTYRREFPVNYTNTDAAGRTFGCYIVDNWSDATMGDPNLTVWKAWGGLNKVTLLSYWQVKDQRNGSVLFEARATTWTENGVTVNGLTKALDYMDAHKDKIRDSGDIELVRIQH